VVKEREAGEAVRCNVQGSRKMLLRVDFIASIVAS
jgi:hypothetical protein